VKEGRFREDLFYRLHVFPIAVPPLRSRPEDIPHLVRHFLARIAAEEGKRIRAVSGEALALLAAYRWPGNVRQLENAVFRAVVLAEGDCIGVSEFPQIAAQVAAGSTVQAAGECPSPPTMIHESPPLLEVGTGLGVELGGPAGSQSPHGMLRLLDAAGEVRPLEEIEIETIRFAISHYRGQMSEVARRLRIGRSTLYRKLEHLGLDGPAGAGGKDTVAAG
jgi:DNA-binding NtrC family response regulator